MSRSWINNGNLFFDLSIWWEYNSSKYGILVEESFKVTTQGLVNFWLTAAALNDLRVSKRRSKVVMQNGYGPFKLKFSGFFWFRNEFGFVFASYKSVISLVYRVTNV